MDANDQQVDQQASLELALGGFVVSYGQLMVLVKLAACSLVNAADPAVGGILLDPLSDAALEDAWYKLAKHRAGKNSEVLARIASMHTGLVQLRRQRNANVHCAYIATVTSDPLTQREYRAASRARVQVKAGRLVPPTPIELAEIHDLTKRCEALRLRFLSEFTPTRPPRS